MLQTWHLYLLLCLPLIRGSTFMFLWLSPSMMDRCMWPQGRVRKTHICLNKWVRRWWNYHGWNWWCKNKQETKEWAYGFVYRLYNKYLCKIEFSELFCNPEEWAIGIWLSGSNTSCSDCPVIYAGLSHTLICLLSQILSEIFLCCQ